MVKIADRVYLVGSGKFGVEMTDPTDCHIYMLDGGSECALIDAGSGIEPERIVENIRRCGFDMDRVKYCVLTHVHVDHAAGAHYFHETYGIGIIASGEAAEWLERGDMDKTSLNFAKRKGVYPADFRFPACPVEKVVREGDRLKVGDIELAVIDSPGHSRGHICLLWEDGRTKSLFAGDAVFADGKIIIQRIWDCVIDQYAETVAKLHGLKIDRLYPGHGPFLLSRASQHIEKAHRCFEKLLVPPNLI